MRLSELVSDLTPATFTIVAMVIFLAVFVGVAIRTFRPGAREEHRRALQLPLDDGGQP
jgi:cbb3-type cytochrome oxidase subunit 3